MSDEKQLATSQSELPTEVVIAECRNAINWFKAMRRNGVKVAWDAYQQDFVKKYNKRIANRWFAKWRKKIDPITVVPFSEEIFQRICKEKKEYKFDHYEHECDWIFPLSFHYACDWFDDEQQIAFNVYQLANSAHASQIKTVLVSASDWKIIHSTDFNTHCKYKDILPDSEKYT